MSDEDRYRIELAEGLTEDEKAAVEEARRQIERARADPRTRTSRVSRPDRFAYPIGIPPDELPADLREYFIGSRQDEIRDVRDVQAEERDTRDDER